MYLSRDTLDTYKQCMCVCVCVCDSTHSTLFDTLLFSLNNISASGTSLVIQW